MSEAHHFSTIYGNHDMIYGMIPRAKVDYCVLGLIDYIPEAQLVHVDRPDAYETVPDEHGKQMNCPSVDE